MHYVILITHQSDIKICTTNLFFWPARSFACLPLLAVTPFAFQSLVLSMCAHSMRRSLITFPSNEAHLTPRSAARCARFSLQQCFYCTYHRNGSKLLLYTLALQKRTKKIFKIMAS